MYYATYMINMINNMTISVKPQDLAATSPS